MKKDFTFYEVKVLVDKGHEHYSFRTKTFADVNKAHRNALRQGIAQACVIAISTNGQYQAICANTQNFGVLYGAPLEVTC